MNNSSQWQIGRCDFSTTQSLFDAFIYIIIAVVALIENVTIIVCYFRFRPLRHTTNIYLISVTASDIMVSCFSLPFSFGVYLCHLRPPEDQRGIPDLIYLICDMLPSILSIYSLGLISMDRLLAVTRPYIYERYLYPRNATISVGFMWMFVTFLVSLILVLSKRQFTLLIVLMSYVFPVTVMIIAYTIIGYVAKKHAREITHWQKTGYRLKREGSSFTYQEESFRSTHSENLNVDNNKLVPKNDVVFKNGDADKTWATRTKPRRIWRELRASFRLLLLLGTFTLAWTPFMALNIKFYACEETCFIDIKMVQYFKILHYANSALNPLLFILLNKRWRKAVVMALCRPKMNQHESEERVKCARDWS